MERPSDLHSLPSDCRSRQSLRKYADKLNGISVMKRESALIDAVSDERPALTYGHIHRSVEAGPRPLFARESYDTGCTIEAFTASPLPASQSDGPTYD